MTSLPKIFIQGDSPNSWSPAQDWQRDLLMPLYLGYPNPSYYTNHRRYDYVVSPIFSLSQMDSPYKHVLSQVMNLVSIPYYRGVDPGFPPVGFLVNLTTGTVRVYMVGNPIMNPTLLEKYHPHNGPSVTCPDCMRSLSYTCRNLPLTSRSRY